MTLSDWPTTPADGDAEAGPEAGSAPPEAGSAQVAALPPAPRPPLSILDDAARSPDPAVCPFFRFELEGDLVAPLLKPDDGNRCAAIGDPRPQSARQQELVCLRSAHADCPRYLKGTAALEDPKAASRSGAVPKATVAAILILVLSAGISFGFVVQRGGIDLPVIAAAPGSTGIALAPLPSDEPTEPPSVEPATDPAVVEASAMAPSPSAVATPSAIASPSPSSSPSPSAPPSSAPPPTTAPAVTPTPEVTPRPTPKPTKKPQSDRYKLLDPCPSQPKCWTYTVRSGDNLFSIAHYFGIPMSVIYDWNPRYANGARLRAGDQVRMPPPRR